MLASLSGRYASALFELARDGRVIEPVESDMRTLRAALDESADLRALIASRQVSREAGAKAVEAVADMLGLQPLTRRFLGVLAQNGRLAQLPAITRDLLALAARNRGEMTAEVVSAHALDADQIDAIRKQLRSRAGREITVEARVDPSILGGLVVRLGSQMIDSSIRTRLNTLANAMKG